MAEEKFCSEHQELEDILKWGKLPYQAKRRYEDGNGMLLLHQGHQHSSEAQKKDAKNIQKCLDIWGMKRFQLYPSEFKFP